jgi:hypothetical protein
MVMAIRTIFLSGLLMGLTTIALAQSGTPEEQAACRPDVRRFCYKLKEGEASEAFFQCLQEHKSRLSKRCLAVIEKHGA